MKATMIWLAVSLVLTGGSSPVSAQTVAAGIFHSGSTLEVRVKAGGGNVTGNLAEIQFTIRWDNNYGVSLGDVSSPIYSILKNGSEGVQSGFKYQEFVVVYVINFPISWDDGVEQSLMTIPVNQTGTGVGTFELAPADFISGIFDDWYVEVGGNDVTNSTFYQSGTTDVPLPIQLASFSASVVRDNDVEVAWKTVSETNNYGFEVYRKRNENGEWKKLGFIEGHGTTLAEHSYTYLDKAVGFGKYCYQIKQIDLDGKSETFPEMSVTVGVGPDKFVLAQNYPNPFNPTTTIEFALPKETHVSLEVYNVIGQRVATLVDETKPTGIYVVPFNASALASGTYFYRLTTKEVSFIKRMMILK
jgi:hypothetical protein